MTPDTGRGDGERVRVLTQTEERVARLVASGRPTIEVATELGLGPKTVEWHLSRACRKLGLRSGDELAVLLARDPGERHRQGSSHTGENDHRRYSDA